MRADSGVKIKIIGHFEKDASSTSSEVEDVLTILYLYFPGAYDYIINVL